MNQKLFCDHKARKRFGQNFLYDDGIIQKIVATINPKQDDHLIEIGPGQGALTSNILKEAGQLDVIELDRDLIPGLKQLFGSCLNFSIYEADALSFDFSDLRQDHRPLRVVGNLPYNISTPLIFHLLKYHNIIEDMHFMLQKEVVQRMSAQPGDKHHGRLGIMVQYFCQVDYLFPVHPEVFKPPPKVDSALIRLKPHKILPYPSKNFSGLKLIVRAAFGQRRKTIRNTLKHYLSAQELEGLNITPGARPETLSLENFVTIADYLSDSGIMFRS